MHCYFRVGMAWEARSGLKLIGLHAYRRKESVGMAWEARSGLKPVAAAIAKQKINVGMAWEARSGLKHGDLKLRARMRRRSRNGLGSPFGIETILSTNL